MKRPRWVLRCAAIAVAGCTVAATASLTAAAAPRAAAATGPWPTIQLIAAQHSVTVSEYGGVVFLDPGVYLASFGAALQLDVQRASYTRPVKVTQVVRLPGGGTRSRPLPRYVLDRSDALRHFAQLTVRNAAGKVVATARTEFCPDVYDPQRASPDSPATSPYPTGCADDPFPKSFVLGVQKGWAADPFEDSPPLALAAGSYRVTASITREYTRLLHITAAHARVTVRVKVVKGTGCCGARAASRARPQSGALPRLPNVPELAHPPAAARPDLVPLPSWGISTSHTKATKNRVAADHLNFGATVWVGGNSPLDVEGFRSHGSPIMKAYQYYWRNGRVVGRTRAGTMGFDRKKGHDHWHFEQFAQYRLLNATKKLVLRSRKVGFCIAPTDPVSLLLPHADWNPQFLGFGGACGSPSALWVQELMPIGWGDTYIQSVAGQSFGINQLPNGVYYIEVVANPERVLHETSTRNDVSLRKVILGGSAGHRTVRVPAWHGLDPER